MCCCLPLLSSPAEAVILFLCLPGDLGLKQKPVSSDTAAWASLGGLVHLARTMGHLGWGSDNRLPVLQWEDLGTSLGGGATSGRPQDPELGSAFSGLNLRQPSRPTSSVTISEHEAAQAQMPFPLPLDPGMLPPSAAALTASQRDGTAPETQMCPPVASVKQEADLPVSCCVG